MLLTIHNLPAHMQYANVRLLIQTQCGIKADDVILDNFVNEGRSKKVTVGLVGEKQAEILKRKFNGMQLEGHQLYVKDLRENQAFNEKTNNSSVYQKNNSQFQQSQAFQSQAQQSQQGFYATNLNQYEPEYGYGNQQYMSQEQIMQMMMMNPQMMGMGGMPPQNPYMDVSGQMQSAIAPPYTYNQQEQNVDSAKKNDRSSTNTKNWGRDDNDDYNSRHQYEGDGGRRDSRNFDRDDEYNNRYQVDQYASKNNDRAMNERSQSWGRDDNSRNREESNQAQNSSNQANRSPWTTDRERSQRSNYQSGRDSRSRSRSPYYEERERAVARDRYQDIYTGRPEDLYQRKHSAYTAVASTSQQYCGSASNNSQGFNYGEMNESMSERYNPKSEDRGNQPGNRWDKPDKPSNPLPQIGNRLDKLDSPFPQSCYRWDKRDKPSKPLPQSGNRLDKPDNPFPQSCYRWDKRDKPSNPLPQSGNRWNKPNSLIPQTRGSQPQGNRWDKPNNPLPQSRDAQPQGDRWDRPNNPSLQSKADQPQGDRWVKSSTSQPREPQRSAPPERKTPQPHIWEDRNPSLVKGNIQPLMQKPVPPPPKMSKKMKPKNKRNNAKAPKVKLNMTTLRKNCLYRGAVAFTIADQICKQGLPTHIVADRKAIKRSVMEAVLQRIEIILKNESVKGKEMINRYREKFPTSTDREILKESYERISKNPLPPASGTDEPTSANPPGAVEKTTKAEPASEDKVTVVSYEPMVPDKPENLKADVTVKKEVISETPAAVANIPKQVKPNEPAAPQVVGKLPKYPNGDKQSYKDNKKLADKEFEEESGYELDPVLKNALEMELNPIIEIFRSELIQSSTSAEEQLLSTLISRQDKNFGKCLHVHMTKRLLDIRTNLILRIFVHGKPVHQSLVENLLRQYGVISLKKSVKQGPLYYIVECSNYEGYDQLREIGSFSHGTETTLMIKPFHIAGPVNKPKGKGKGRGKGQRR